MEKIKAAYNFVPLNKYVYQPEWSENISQDVPFSDGEDGIIEISIKNISPLFIRNGNEKSNVSEYSANISSEADKQKQYFLPATSLKGMFRSVLEILSFSSMKQFNNDSFGYREIGKQFSNSDYTQKMKNVKCGWLINKGDDLYIIPCAGDYKTISHNDIKGLFHGFNEKDTADRKQIKVSRNSESLYPEIDGYCLVCTGPMNGKKNEYLFPLETLEEKKLSDRVKEVFYSVHKPTPLFGKVINGKEGYYLKKLKKGEKIPVFYLEQNGEIDSVGLSKLFRYPYKHDVKYGIRQNIKNPSKLDLCESIFGYVNKNNALRGRVHIGNAFANRLIDDNELRDNSGVLGEPKPSYYPLYLKQNKSQYLTYRDDDIEIAGRKRYRIHKGNTVTEMSKGNDNENVLTKFKTLPSNIDFNLKIHVHNLKPVETGALLSAITFHNTQGVWHNIGQAKAYGFGKIVCSVNSIKGFKYSFEHYLRCFEKEMSAFTYEHMEKLWNKTEQVSSLLGIASEHEDNEVHVMSLKEYGEAKKNENFSKLKEPYKEVQSLLNKEDLEENKIRHFIPDIEEAEKYYKDKNFEQALSSYNSIKNEMIIAGCNVEKVKKRIEEIEVKKDDFERQEKERKEKEKKAAEAKRRELEEKEKAERIQNKKSTGLSFLEDKNIYGNYKVSDFKGAKNRINRWLKQTKINKVPEDQISILERSLIRIYSNPKEKRNKKWKDFEDKNIWGSIKGWVGTEKAKEWYNKLSNNE